MRHQYLMIDSRGNPVAHGTSDDGLEKSVWEIQVDSGELIGKSSGDGGTDHPPGWKYHLSRVGPKAGRRCAAQPADAGPV